MRSAMPAPRAPRVIPRGRSRALERYALLRRGRRRRAARPGLRLAASPSRQAVTALAVAAIALGHAAPATVTFTVPDVTRWDGPAARARRPTWRSDWSEPVLMPRAVAIGFWNGNHLLRLSAAHRALAGRPRPLAADSLPGRVRGSQRADLRHEKPRAPPAGLVLLEVMVALIMLSSSGWARCSSPTRVTLLVDNARALVRRRRLAEDGMELAKLGTRPPWPPRRPAARRLPPADHPAAARIGPMASSRSPLRFSSPAAAASTSTAWPESTDDGTEQW